MEHLGMTRSKLLYISRQYRLVVAIVVSLLRGAKSRRSLFGSVGYTWGGRCWNWMPRTSWGHSCPWFVYRIGDKQSGVTYIAVPVIHGSIDDVNRLELAISKSILSVLGCNSQGTKGCTSTKHPNEWILPKCIHHGSRPSSKKSKWINHLYFINHSK